MPEPLICYRFGIETSERGPGCEPVGETQVTTVSVGANKKHLRKAEVIVTRKGLATSDNDDNDDIFGPGGTLGGRSSSSSSTDSTLRPIDDLGSGALTTTTIGGADGGLSKASPNIEQNTKAVAAPAPSKAPTPPSTRPYIWKYQ